MLDVRQLRWIELEFYITPGYHRVGGAEDLPRAEENAEKSLGYRMMLLTTRYQYRRENQA
jgi:hypothetical protein